jgi:hypothetical protein
MIVKRICSPLIVFGAWLVVGSLGLGGREYGFGRPGLDIFPQRGRTSLLRAQERLAWGSYKCRLQQENWGLVGDG